MNLTEELTTLFESILEEHYPVWNCPPDRQHTTRHIAGALAAEAVDHIKFEFNYLLDK